MKINIYRTNEQIVPLTVLARCQESIKYLYKYRQKKVQARNLN